MSRTAGIDVGSTYTKAVVVAEDGSILGRAMEPTGFKLAQAAERALARALEPAGLRREDVAYVVTTGFGRHQAGIGDVSVTDLTAAARGATHFFPNTRTILDVGGQTMKASRLGADAKVQSFRLNDKCAAGTGAFLEKTARYMGYGTEEIGPLVATSKAPVTISGVCAVFAESEVINQLSEGSAPADIMHGAIVSLVDRSVQLMKRVRHGAGVHADRRDPALRPDGRRRAQRARSGGQRPARRPGAVHRGVRRRAARPAPPAPPRTGESRCLSGSGASSPTRRARLRRSSCTPGRLRGARRADRSPTICARSASPACWCGRGCCR